MNESGPPKAPPPSTVEGACAPIGAGRAVRPREFRVSGSRRTSRNEVPHPAGAALESAPGRAVTARFRRRGGGGPAAADGGNPPKLTEPRSSAPAPAAALHPRIRRLAGRRDLTHGLQGGPPPTATGGFAPSAPVSRPPVPQGRSASPVPPAAPDGPPVPRGGARTPAVQVTIRNSPSRAIPSDNAAVPIGVRFTCRVSDPGRADKSPSVPRPTTRRSGRPRPPRGVPGGSTH